MEKAIVAKYNEFMGMSKSDLFDLAGYTGTTEEKEAAAIDATVAWVSREYGLGYMDALTAVCNLV